MKGYLEKLPTLEAAVSALESPVLKDNDIFDDTCGKCKSYTRMFVDGSRATTDSQIQALGDPLSKFVEKYELMESSVETWNLKEVEWVFLPDTEEEVRHDLTGLKQAMKQLNEFLSSLETLGNHTSAFSDLATLATKAQKQAKELKSKSSAAGKTATVVIFANMVVCDAATSGREDVEKIEKHVHKHFGTGLATLPKMLLDKVTAVKANKKPAAAGEKPSEQKKRKSDQTQQSSETAPASGKKFKKEKPENDKTKKEKKKEKK